MDNINVVKTPHLWEKINALFKGKVFFIKDVHDRFTEEKKDTIRGRIYEHLGKEFQRIGRGIYFVGTKDEAVALIEGDGRDLSVFSDDSFDCIITDHLWPDEKANIGGYRSFANYETFRYSPEDFKEKARVLKEGCFLVEMIPAKMNQTMNICISSKKWLKLQDSSIMQRFLGANVEQILDYLTFEGEIVLDQFAGSGVVGEACIKKKRGCVLIEKSKECIKKIIQRLGLSDCSVISSAVIA